MISLINYLVAFWHFSAIWLIIFWIKHKIWNVVVCVICGQEIVLLYSYLRILICKTNRGQELPVKTVFSSIFYTHLRVHNNNCYDSNVFIITLTVLFRKITLNLICTGETHSLQRQRFKHHLLVNYWIFQILSSSHIAKRERGASRVKFLKQEMHFKPRFSMLRHLLLVLLWHLICLLLGFHIMILAF